MSAGNAALVGSRCLKLARWARCHLKAPQTTQGRGKPECVSGDLGGQRKERQGVILHAKSAHHRVSGDAGHSTPWKPGQTLPNTFYSEMLEVAITEVQM